MLQARVCLIAIMVALPCAAAARAQATTFSYTSGEQTFTVPADVSSLRITAIGGAGGSPDAGTGLPGGRGAVVSGIVAVTPGQVLYVYVGGAGGLPAGGFNGGGYGGATGFGMTWGGGGASDVSTVPDSAGTASLQARLIVAAGGGGSAGIAAGGGDAGAAGGCCGAAGNGPNAAQAGTQTAGGSGGGCATLTEGCGGNGGLGFGGVGGASGTGPDARTGGGGGGGLYGGGGGAGNVNDTGGGAGGSSLVPPGGTLTVAPSLSTPPRIDIDPYTPPPPPPRCADLIDNDGDGLIDFPADRGCSSASDGDETNPSLAGGGTQKLGRWVVIALRCSDIQDCTASAKGTLAVRGTKRHYALRPVASITVGRGTQVTLRLKLPVNARAAAKRALRRKRKVRATVTVTVADSAGNATTLTRTIKLVR